ncbi:unnamed protein product [Somion occarium]|uniref:Transcription factor tau subunit sfc3 n=1 Tax=Somion occarium TaxID=3059160 RepID=A0ABP1CNM2_9APHY
MDELIHHCIHELSFDGDLGCNVSRLRDFILDFYARSEQAQVVDDALCAFVWSVVVQQPNVRVGIVPPDVDWEVYIAPQPSTKRKGKGQTEGEEDGQPVSLQVIPDAAIKPLEELVRQYGNTLRIAVDPETSFVAISGSHARPAKLTGMVYTALQLIARGREHGLSVVDLSKKTGYDAKTCHYLVDKLLELNLIVKRKKSGVGGNLCIHKYFFERSAAWQMVLAEEAEAQAIEMLKMELDEEPNVEEDAEGQVGIRTDLNFGPIDLKHLSSLPLVRARVVKLLKNSPSYMHATHNLLVTLGFPHPSKTDRRFFASRLRELMAEGLIEKVQVPHPKRKNAIVTCVRLLSPPEVPSESPVEAEDEDEGLDSKGLKANLTIHKQIIDLVHNSGTVGITLNELSSGLCNFDKRIIELLLSRLERSPPPAHLSDLAITQTQETYGRERRFRYFTLVNYKIVAQKETLQADYDDIDMSQAGAFLPIDAEWFYGEEADLNKFVDDFKLSEEGKDKAKGKAKATSKAKPSPKSKEPKPKPPPKPKTPKVYKNPILPDGTVKRGRPRKEWASQRVQKRKRDEANEVEGDGDGEMAITSLCSAAAEPPTKKRRGRPSKKQPQEVSPAPGPSGHSTQQGKQTDERIVQSDTMHDIVLTTDDNALQSEEQVTVPFAGSSLSVTPDAQTFLEAAPNESVMGMTSLPSTVIEEGLSDIASSVPLATSLEHVHTTSTSSAPGQYQDSLSEFQVTQDVAMQIIQSFSAASMPEGEAVETTQDDVTIDYALPQGIPEGLAIMNESMTQPLQSSSALSEPSTNIDVDLSSSPHAEGESSKRPVRESISSMRPAKRAKIRDGARSKANPNVTQVRREKEVMRIIEESGGIVNTSSKEFLEAHSALVDMLTKEGEPVSVIAGSRMDKRTVDATLKNLEDRGKIKMVSTIVSNGAGLSRSVRVAYLPETSADALQAFLDNIRRNLRAFLPAAPVKTLDEPVIYGGLKSKTPVPPASTGPVLDSKKNPEVAEKIFQGDDESIPRARELHLMTMDFFENVGQSSSVVSTEQRIIHVSHYFSEIPVSAYCAIVACLIPNDELLQLLNSPDGRKTPVGSLPSSIQNTLQPSKSRSQARIQDLLGILQVLQLATPLQPAYTETPAIRVPASGQHPTAFEPISANVPTPQYWQFNTSAPLYLWALSERSPPFWKEVPVTSTSEAVEFWKNLERVCIDEPFASSLSDLPQDMSNHAAGVPDTIARSLRRSRDWSTDYSLSWYQTEYLRLFVDKATGNTPLQDEDGGQARLEKIIWVVSASETAVRQFYAREYERYFREKDKMKKKKKRSAEERAKRKAEDKAALARRAAEAKQQRERDWDELVLRVHPEPLKGSAALRVRRVRAHFLQGPGVDVDKWESEVRKAIEEAEVTAKTIISSSKPSLGAPLPAPAPPPVVSTAPPGLSVDELIELLRSAPARPEKEKKKKPKKGEKRPLDEPKERRYRFQWNAEFDELARDASVIIRSRCRDQRLDWSALAQIFEPTIPRNSVRQRIVKLRELPGAETYFKRLEDKWHDLWVRNRGTDVLPDDDPASPSNFDLITHIKFLRSHIDKNALRVGFVEIDDTVNMSLPSSVEELEKTLDVVEQEVAAPAFDFVWTDPADDSRERRLMRTAFLTKGNEVPLQQSYPDDSVYIADTTLKMVLSTSKEAYDPEAAAALLKSIGEESVKTATRLMLSRNVLSKMVRDISKPRPGRTLKISDSNMYSLGGLFQLDVFQDAIAQEDELLAEPEDGNEWREWSLLATDGDAAALIELASEGKLDFQVDTSHAQSTRAAIDWNSKKADDDDIETAIHIRFVNDAQQMSTTPSEVGPMVVEPTQVSAEDTTHEHNDTTHGTTTSGAQACCKKNGTLLVDCAPCLAEEADKVLHSLDQSEAEIAKHILNALHEASAKGITKVELRAAAPWSSPTAIAAAIDHLTNATIPLAFWSGYTKIVLVSSEFLKAWTAPVLLSEGALTQVFPRRWLDINGRELADVLESAHRAVMGVILFKPGITETEIRWQLRSVYDRQEINDVLCYLLAEGYIKKHVYKDSILLATGPLDDAEETGVFWTVGDRKHWYTVQ